MRIRSVFVLTAALWLAWPVLSRQDPTVCGTHGEKANEQLQLHRRAARLRAEPAAGERAAAAPRAFDVGDIAILEDHGDLASVYNAFNLSFQTVTFTPTGGGYQFETTGDSWDQAATAGSLLANLGDDDAREVALPFAFPFYGAVYQKLFVNSDGNLTFGESDTDTGDRSLGRMTAGPPRIAPFFDDLDPARSSYGVFTLAEPERFVVSWVAVPEFESLYLHSFQVRLYPDGRIELAYREIYSNEAVVGISPGRSMGVTTLVAFREDDSGVYPGTIAERFTTSSEIDVYAVGKLFYETHEDAYDYLVIYNYMGIAAAPSAVAWEMTVRNVNRSGYGDPPADYGAELGSARRLQAVINMGPLQQYSADPDARLGPRGAITGDTAMTILGHEAGHLFLAFASVRDPQNAFARPMLKPDLAHWSFNFNSEASLVEGNRIQDLGDGNFVTAGTVEGYSLLDQYLMGFIPADQVPPTFRVANSSQPDWQFSSAAPRPFTGVRRNITIEEIVAAEGPRLPNPSVSQRHFRFAFILVVNPATQPPTGEDLQKIETFRSKFAEYYAGYTTNRATAEATLRRALQLSVAPAVSLRAGGIMSATVSIEKPADAPLVLALERPPGAAYALISSSVTIPAGFTSASFQIFGIVPGTDDLVARADDPQYEVAHARIQVTGDPMAVRLHPVVVTGASLQFRVTDGNNVVRPGQGVLASAYWGGTVSPAVATSDVEGLVRFDWDPGASGSAVLSVRIEGTPEPEFDLALNGASGVVGLSPGAYASILGRNLSGGATATSGPPYPEELVGVAVSFDGLPAGLHSVSDQRIELVAPPASATGMVNLSVQSIAGGFVLAQVSVLPASPGIFFDALTGLGAVRRVANALEIYGTGIGTGLAVTVRLGGFDLTPFWFGPNSVFPGLDQVNVDIPPGLTGEQTLSIEVNGVRSNEVRVFL